MINHNPNKNAIRIEEKLKISEADEQTALFDWAKWNLKRYPELEFLHHIANGEYRPKITGKRLKALGVKPGVPDIHLPVGRHGFNALFIELKAKYIRNKKDGGLTKEQLQWIKHLNIYENHAVVCYGFEEAKEVIEWYLGG